MKVERLLIRRLSTGECFLTKLVRYMDYGKVTLINEANPYVGIQSYRIRTVRMYTYDFSSFLAQSITNQLKTEVSSVHQTIQIVGRLSARPFFD